MTLTDRDRAIVEALSEGLTDVEVADRLGISPRTVAYALRALMDRFGVDNRFQLGLAIGAAEDVPIPGHDSIPTEP